MNKILVFVLIFLIFSGSVMASDWKKVKDEQIKNLKLEVWLNNANYNRSGDYLMYAVRFKNKEVGDYVNTICTDCRDYSSVVLDTQLYDKNFIPQYPDFSEINSNFVPIDKTSMLMSVAPKACRELTSVSNTKSSVKSKNEKSKTPSGEGGFKKFIKGVGSFFKFILIAPIAIVIVVLQALAGT